MLDNFLDNDTVSDEVYIARLRHWRNQKLAATDWTQLSDAVCDKAAWATYRQALRDMPASNSDPKKVIFPNEPNQL